MLSFSETGFGTLNSSLTSTVLIRRDQMSELGREESILLGRELQHQFNRTIVSSIRSISLSIKASK